MTRPSIRIRSVWITEISFPLTSFLSPVTFWFLNIVICYIYSHTLSQADIPAATAKLRLRKVQLSISWEKLCGKIAKLFATHPIFTNLTYRATNQKGKNRKTHFFPLSSSGLQPLLYPFSGSFDIKNQANSEKISVTRILYCISRIG